MTQVATIGPVSFHLSGVVYALLPPTVSEPALCVGGDEMTVTRDGERSYLVVDHRSDADEMARVELWLAASPGEGGLDGLFVLSATRNVPPVKREAETLAAIARRFPLTTPA